MFARVTKFDVSPEHLQQGHREIEGHVLPALRMQVGYSGGLLLGNRESGKMLSVTLWEEEQEMRATDEASHWFRVFGPEAGITTTLYSTTVSRVVRKVLRGPMSLEGQQSDVIFLLPPYSGELLQLGQQRIDQRRLSRVGTNKLHHS
jgi:hypothetical protein